MNNSLTFVIIPSFNEDVNIIRQTIQLLTVHNYTIVLVDDGSKKDIFSELADLPVVYLRHLINLGQGAALQTGMEYAKQEGAEFVVHFDSDGQHSVEEIEILLDPLRKDQADVVMGSRFIRKSDTLSIPWVRRLILWIARIVNGLFTGMWLTDAHNGLRALNQKAFSLIQLTENRQAHATEILYMIRYHSLRVIEIPSHITYTTYSRAKGQTSMNSISIFIDLLLNKIFR